MDIVYSDPNITAILRPLPQSPKLLDRLRLALRTKHYSHRIEEAYVGRERGSFQILYD